MEHQLLTKGYYVGKVSEIVSNLSELDVYCNKLIELSADKSKYYAYRHNIDDAYSELPHRIAVHEVDERKKHVEDTGLKVFQQWYESIRDPDGKMEPVRDYFRNITFDAVSKIYPELTRKNTTYNDSFTIFEDGDFIKSHTDGNNNIGRVCVILIYISDPLSYNDGGGKLFITDKETHFDVEEVVPLKGTFVLIDFTKHDIEHRVELVKNNFKRHCYISFVYNSDLLKDKNETKY